MNHDELARRAVKSPHWRWMPGMRWRTDDDAGRLDDYQPEYMGRPSDALPDLTDPATVGCLYALLREHWGGHCFAIANGFEAEDEVWSVHDGRFGGDGYGHMIAVGSTEVEALVKALGVEP